MSAICCPEANTRGRPVKFVTVSSLVRPEHRPLVAGRAWSYCGDPACDVVYFAEDGAILRRSDLAVRVGEKEADPPRTVCYCFGHTRESIRDEVLRTGASDVVDAVAAKVRAKECSCETMNPKGTCCLADLRKAVEEARS